MAILSAADRAFWEENGYVVVPNVVPQQNLDAVIDTMWDFLGMDPSEPETWYTRPGWHSQTGMVELYQHQALWDNRQYPRVHEAFVRLREQGKVRFLGVATDAPNLELVAHGALESDRFDVLTLAHHPGAWPELPERIARAAALDVGVLASDPLTGAIGALPDWRPGGSESFAQAALDLVLANPGVASVVVRIGRPEALDELLFVSGRG